MKHYLKAESESILSEINDIIKARPSYGYKRVAAMLNKKRLEEDVRKINKKRIYRIMDINGLLIKKSSAPRRIHPKTGKIVTRHSNTC